jgi:hypothetical protein
MKSELSLVNNGLSRTVDCIIYNGVRQATAYLSEHEVIRATRRQYGKEKWRKNEPIEMLLTIGRPNYRERLFIKSCKKAGEPFPVKNIQIKFPRT